MGNFTGTKEEFNKYFDGYCKNIINRWAAPLRKEQNGICEYCGNKDELDSAHLRGQERKVIINSILDEHIVDGVVNIDMDIFEKELKNRHDPIRKHFYFLCKFLLVNVLWRLRQSCGMRRREKSMIITYLSFLQ